MESFARHFPFQDMSILSDRLYKKRQCLQELQTMAVEPVDLYRVNQKQNTTSISKKPSSRQLAIADMYLIFRARWTLGHGNAEDEKPTTVVVNTSSTRFFESR
jgi:hypothetical protein